MWTSITNLTSHEMSNHAFFSFVVVVVVIPLIQAWISNFVYVSNLHCCFQLFSLINIFFSGGSPCLFTTAHQGHQHHIQNWWLFFLFLLFALTVSMLVKCMCVVTWESHAWLGPYEHLTTNSSHPISFRFGFGLFYYLYFFLL